MGKVIFLATLLAAFALAGCGGDVTRISAETDTLSKGLSDSDTKLLVNGIVDDMLKSPQFTGIMNAPDGKRPVVGIIKIKNATEERLGDWIDLFSSLTKEKLYTQVNFIDPQTRTDLREELKMDEEGYVLPEEAQSKGKERGSLYLLSGTLHGKTEAVGSKDYHRYYALSMQLVKRPGGDLIWIKNFDIKKRVKGGKWEF